MTDDLLVPNLGRDRSTGLITLEALLVNHPGWVVRADIDDSGDQAEVVALTVLRQDHPTARTSTKGLNPSGSVTAALLRSIPLTEVLQHASDLLRFTTPKRLTDPHKLNERSPEYYATWAELYVDAVRRHPRRAIAELAEAHDMERTAVRDLINRCRSKGYLTPGRPGKAGGELTESALEVLGKGKR